MASNMSTFNKLRNRKEKSGISTIKNVMSPPAEPFLSSPSESTSSASSSLGFPGSYDARRSHTRSSSLSSLSIAFPAANAKRSPRLQATKGTIESSTANSCDNRLLQPKQTSGFLNGSFPEEERRVSEEEEGDNKARSLATTSENAH